MLEGHTEREIEYLQDREMQAVRLWFRVVDGHEQPLSSRGRFLILATDARRATLEAVRSWFDHWLCSLWLSVCPALLGASGWPMKSGVGNE